MWSPAQKEHPWGDCEECRLLGPAPGLPSHNLCFSKTPMGSVKVSGALLHSSTWFHSRILYAALKHTRRIPVNVPIRSHVGAGSGYLFQ